MKELGFPQDGIFGWYIGGDPKPESNAVVMANPQALQASGPQLVSRTFFEGPPEQLAKPRDFKPSPAWWPHMLLCTAPTVAEMGEWMLPGSYSVRDAEPGEVPWASWDETENLEWGGSTEAEARALWLTAMAESRDLDVTKLAGPSPREPRG
jgi:hypothetical protein